jgi:HPr kinase/phosphorylase
MRFHASCAARPGPDGGLDAVLLLGAAGSGKSDFLLRLMGAGWQLVADDQVIVENGLARAPASLAGMLEVRGLGLFRLPFAGAAPLRLIVRLGARTVRLPEPAHDSRFDLPVVTIDPGGYSAPQRLALALEAACGRVENIAGAFAA